MGNILDHGGATDGDVEAEDLKWLATNTESVFNESYLSEIFQSLKFVDADGSAEKKSTDDGRAGAGSLPPARFSHMLDIFSKTGGSDDGNRAFDLFVQNYISTSVYSVSLARRARLLRRIHLALVRDAERSNSPSKSSTYVDYLKSKSESKDNEVDNAEALLTATSVRMSLAIMDCLGMSNPELFKSVAETLLDLMKHSSHMAFSGVPPNSARGGTIKAIMQFCEKTAVLTKTASIESSSASQLTAMQQNTAYAIGLMLSVAVSTGSISNLLSTANLLQSSDQCLPSYAHCFVNRLSDIPVHLSLLVPTSANVVSSFSIEVRRNTIPDKEIPRTSSTVATDGTHLYVWDGFKCSISKIGTGMHGTISGNEYSATFVEAQICSWLGSQVYEGLMDEKTDKDKPTVDAESSSMTLRTIIDTRIICPYPGQDIQTCFDGEAECRDPIDIDAGYEANILEERMCIINYEEDDENEYIRVPFFRVDTDENGWIAGYIDNNVHNDSDYSSERSYDASEQDLIPAVELVTTAGGVSRPLPEPILPDRWGVTSSSSRHASGSNAASTSGEVTTFKAAVLSCANGKLYLRMLHLLGPVRVAVFSVTTMQLEDIIPLQLPIAAVKRAVNELYKSDGVDSLFADPNTGAQDMLCDEEDEVVEWIVGNPVNYASHSHGCSILSASSRFIGDDDVSFAGILVGEYVSIAIPSDIISNVTAQSRFFVFEDNDVIQEVLLDLGSVREITEIGAEVLNGESSRAMQRMEVFVSADGDNFAPWNSTDLIVPSANNESVGKCIVSTGENYDGPLEIRYVKYAFGAAAEAGVLVFRLFAMGCSRTKKEQPIPLPTMFSDGRHLFFIHSYKIKSESTEDDEASKNGLRVFCTDPLDSMCVVWEKALDTSNNFKLLESDFAQCSFVCNSEQLMIMNKTSLAAPKKKEDDCHFHKYTCRQFDLSSATAMVKESMVKDLVFKKSDLKGYPSSLCYDSRNNCLWGYDYLNYRGVHWRNIGPPPIFGLPMNAIDVDFCNSTEVMESDYMFSCSTRKRLEVLSWHMQEKKSEKPHPMADFFLNFSTNEAMLLHKRSELDAAFLLSELDRLSEHYGPRDVAVGDSRVFSEICVTSTSDLCRFEVRGLVCDVHIRGVNLVVLDDRFMVSDSRDFDSTTSQWELFYDYVKSIPDGTIVLVGVKDIGRKNKISDHCKEALHALGADKKIDNIGDVSFSIIGCKGAAQGTVRQAVAESKKGKAVVRQSLPPRKIALMVEATAETISSLIGVIMKLKDNQSDSVMNKVSLLSCVNILTVNVHQLLHGVDAETASSLIPEADRANIESIANSLIHKELEDIPTRKLAKASLRLFIASVDILYSSSASKCQLLVKYLDYFRCGTISECERTILELLLRKMSDPTAISVLLQCEEVSGDKADDETHRDVAPESLVTALLSICMKETIDDLRFFSSSSPLTLAAGERSSFMNDAATALFTTLCNRSFSLSVHSLVVEKSSVKMCQHLKLVTLMCRISNDIVRVMLDPTLPATDLTDVDNSSDNLSMQRNASLCRFESDVVSSDYWGPNADNMLKNSLIGSALPTALSCLALLSSSGEEALLLPNLADVAYDLCSLTTNVSKAIARIPPSSEKEQDDSSFVQSTTETFESLHPYLANTNEVIPVHFPNCCRITITFGDRTKTENGYDFVRLWKNADKTESLHPGTDKLTGRSDNKSWPGLGNKPPLVYEGDSFFIEWKTDGSNEDWGWEMFCQVEFSETVTHKHWLLNLEQELIHCGAMVGNLLLKCVPVGSEEEENAAWLETPLLENGLKPQEEKAVGGPPSPVKESNAEATESTSTTNESPDVTPKHNSVSKDIIDSLRQLSVEPEEEEQEQFMTTNKPPLLQSLVDRPNGSLGESLCGIMKKLVKEDIGKVEDINRAVYATCAALIKHNNLEKEALSIACGIRQPTAVSAAFIKAWRSGQKMRHFFDVGDMSATTTSSSSSADTPASKLKRTPSAYRGASSEAVHEIANSIVSKCLFLLRMGKKADRIVNGSESAARRGTKLMDKLTKQSSNTGSPFQAIVGEVQTAFELKGIMSFRRQIVQRREENQRVGGDVTMTENVLRFVQSHVNVDHLESAMASRDHRASYRSQGIELYDSLIDSSKNSPFCAMWLLSHFTNTIGRANQGQSRVHIRSSLEGTSSLVQNNLAAKFGSFMLVVVSMMASAFTKSKNDNLSEYVRKEWKKVVVSCVAACSFDFEAVDHIILDQSNLLRVLERLLFAENTDIRTVAWSLFKKLIPTYDGSEIAGEPSIYSKKLMALVVSTLVSAYNNVEAVNTQRAKIESFSASSIDSLMMRNLPKYSVIVPSLLTLCRSSTGVVAPHLPLGVAYTFSVWVRPQRSRLHDVLAANVPAIGMRVCRGPHWSASHLEDGGEEGLGTVIRADEMHRVTVQWDIPHSPSFVYLFGKEENGVKKYEVSLVDENVGGNIVAKGTPALLDDDSDNMKPWNNFGLKMKKDGKVAFFASGCDADEVFYNSSKDPLPPDTWSHVAVVQNKSKNNIYVNGVPSGELTLPPHMLYVGCTVSKKSTIVESPHPYLDGSNSYTVVEFPGATSISIISDIRTKTESNYDYVRFYHDDSHSSYYGAEKYTGGRNNSSSNWPGLLGRPPLVVPASRFVVYFKSDNSNNDWGYRFTCVAQFPPEQVAQEYKHSEFLPLVNRQPIYIGQPPSYVSKPPVSSFEGDVCLLTVFEEALAPSVVELLAAESPLSSTAIALDEELCMRVFSVMQRSVSTLGGLIKLGSGALSGVHVLHPLLSLAGCNTAPTVQIAALRVCGGLFPSSTVELVNTQAVKAGLVCTGQSFIAYLMKSIGHSLNTWVLCHAKSDTRASAAVHCREARLGVTTEQLNLLRILSTSAIWEDMISDLLVDTTSRAAGLVEILADVRSNEESSVFDDHFVDELDSLFAMLNFVGGAGLTGGLFLGSKALYAVGDDMVEECTILSPTWPPPPPGKKGSSSAPMEAHRKLWKDCDYFGGAVAIVLSSLSNEIEIVPRSKINILRQTAFVDPKFSEFLEKHVDSLTDLFRCVSKITTEDPRVPYLPKVETKEVVKIFESAHPYAKNTSARGEFTPVVFEGAKEITIEFDSQSRTGPNDYVRIYKSEKHTEYFGLPKYTGKDANKSWAGVGSLPPLVIKGNKFVLHWNVCSAPNVDWGYKLTAKAVCTIQVDAPARPPLKSRAVLSDLKCVGLRSMSNLMSDRATASSWIVPSSMGIMDSLLTSALAVHPVASKKLAYSLKPVMFEGAHPYPDNAKDYIPVCIKGAKGLKIVFDDLTNTERGPDYIKLYKDSSYSEMWGDKYTGDAVNFPGTSNGRPPLIIPVNNFIIHFRSDGSVNSWGWRMYVSPDGGGKGLSMDFGNAQETSSENSMYVTSCFQQLLVDGPAAEKESPDLSSFQLSTDSPSGTCNVVTSSSSSSDTARVEDTTSSTIIKETEISKKWLDSFGCELPHDNEQSILGRRFFINAKESSEVSVYSEADSSSKTITVFSNTGLGAELFASVIFVVIEQRGCWLHVSFGDKYGWILRRHEDSTFLVASCETEGPESVAGEDGKIVHFGDFSYNTKDLVVIEDDAGGDAGSHVANNNSQSMYQLSDMTGSYKNSGNIPPTSVDVLCGQTENMEVSTYNSMQLSSILLSQDCLSLLLQQWPTNDPFSLDKFGGSHQQLMSFIREIYRRQMDENADSTSLYCLRRRLTDIIKIKDKSAVELCNVLIDFALSKLELNIKPQQKLKPTKALKRVVETNHDYANNMDEEWEVHVPGAQYLRLVFDPRSASEGGCDFCHIKSESGEMLNTHPYTGCGSDKVWAGVGREPPLIVNSDKCTVFFHSDSSNTDWGFLLNVFAVMEGPTEEERAEIALVEEIIAESAIDTDLACWLFDFLSEQSFDIISDILYSSRSLSTFNKFIECMPPSQQKLGLIQLITNMFQDMLKMPGALNNECLLHMRKLQLSIVQYTDSMYKKESSGNQKSTTKSFSPMLLAFVQASLAASTWGSSVNKNSSSTVVNKLMRKESTTSSSSSTCSSSSDAANVASQALSNTEGLFTWSDANLHCSENSGLKVKNYGRSVERTVAAPCDTFEDVIAQCDELAVVTNEHFETTAEVASISNCFIVHFRISRDTNDETPGGMIIGVCDSSRGARFGWAVGWKKFICSNGDGKLIWSNDFNYSVSKGDLISMEINVQQGTVVVYRNFSFLAVPVTPSVSFGGSVVAMEGVYQFKPFAVMQNAGDAVSLVDSNMFDESRRLECRVVKSKEDGEKKVDCPTCSKGHTCIRITGQAPVYSRNSVVYCDCCRARGLEVGDAFYYHCSLCRYDCCSGCYTPPPELVAGVGISKGGAVTLPAWFVALQESIMILSACSSREASQNIVTHEVIPALEDKYSVIVESDQSTSSRQKGHLIHIPGASLLTVKFDGGCQTDPDDVLEVFDGFYVARNSPGEKVDAIEPQCVRRYVGLEGGTTPSVSAIGERPADVLAVGDVVVRGCDWDYMLEDGGAGELGIVTAIKSWKGDVGKGILVKWKFNSEEYLYRWNYSGKFDIRLFSKASDSKSPCSIAGDRAAVVYSPVAPAAVVKETVSGFCTSGDGNEDEIISLELPEEESIPRPPWAGACYFNGASSIRIPSHSNPRLEFTDSCTFESWVYVHSSVVTLMGALNGKYSFLPFITREIELEDIVTQFFLGFRFMGDGSMLLEFQTSRADMTGVAPFLALNSGTDELKLSTWTHVAVTIEGECCSLYINGKLGGTTTVPTARLGSLGAPFSIGADNWEHYHKGFMYDVRLWDVCVSAEDIKKNMHTLPSESWMAKGLVVSLPLLNEACISGNMLEGSVTSFEGVIVNDGCVWNSTAESMMTPSAGNCCYRAVVRPTFTIQRLIEQDKYHQDIQQLLSQYTIGTLRHDTALVKYVNEVAAKRSLTLSQILQLNWTDIAPSNEDLVGMPVLKELMSLSSGTISGSGDIEESKEEGDLEEEKSGEADSTAATPVTPQVNVDAVAQRLSMLKTLNMSLSSSIPLIDLCSTDKPHSLAALVSSCRGLIFHATKAPFFQSVLESTKRSSNDQFDLKLSRSRAVKHARTGVPDVDARFMCFSQAFRAMHVMSPATLRGKGQLYKVIFMGEYSIDAGGPYRESFAMYTMELESPALPLLLRTPNGRHAAGQHRDKWVFHPGSTSMLHLEMFSFLGKLMGIAIRSKNYLALNIAPIIWKLLVKETPTRDDIEAIDVFHQQSNNRLRNIHKDGIDADSFGNCFFETFTAVSIDDRVVDLVPGGSTLDLTFENRFEYCDLADQYRMHCFDRQVEAVRSGLAQIVPITLLSLFTWDQLESMVCGNPGVDIALLKSITEYSSCSATDRHVELFWQAVTEFNMEERAALIRFTWSRSRLPLTAKDFSQRFKIQSFNRSPPDSYLPVAHTCFFSLELPQYSTLEIMKDKLRYAIFNCQAIDGDDTSSGITAAGLGWEE